MNARVQDVTESAQDQNPTIEGSLDPATAGENFVEFVREQPLLAVGLAAVVGFLFGQLIGR